MKGLWKWLPLVWLLVGCGTLNPVDAGGITQLTPYFPLDPTGTVPASSPTPAATPAVQPTPTPFLHTVALSETISDIALRYGISMDAIITANPDVNPNAMVVGMQLVIPGVKGTSGEEQQTASVQVSEPVCLPASRGGWWCTAWVQNDQASNVSSVSVTFTLVDASGGQLAAINTPTLLEWLPPSSRIPAAAYFPPPIQAGSSVTAVLGSAVAMDAAAKRFLPVEIQTGQITVEGRLAQVSGRVVLPADSSSEIGTIWLAALAYDQEGNLVGARRAEIPPAGVDGGVTEFIIYVYSASPDIERVEVLAEAHIK